MWCIDSESGSWNNNGQLKVADAFISEPFQCLRCRDWKSGNWRNYAQLKLTAAFISEPSVMYRLSIWYLTELYTAETDHSFHIGPVGWLTSWCSDPSQPLEILSGLNANFNPCLSYSAHKFFYNIIEIFHIQKLLQLAVKTLHTNFMQQTRTLW